jgi:hypothetical protein
MAFEMGMMVPHAPAEKSRKKIQHLLRLGVLATSHWIDYARNILIDCTSSVKTAVRRAMSREHACEILVSIARSGRLMFDTWSAIVIPHIRANSSRGDRRAPDHVSKLVRANELFLKDYVTKLDNFINRVFAQRYIVLQDVLTALVLMGRIANIPRLANPALAKTN